MELQIPEIDEIKKQIDELKEIMINSVSLNQEWYDLNKLVTLKVSRRTHFMLNLNINLVLEKLMH